MLKPRTKKLVCGILSALALPVVSAVALTAVPAPALAGQSTPAATPGQRPNIVFILADDLGYGDIAILNHANRAPGDPRFQTPNLDQMSRDGMTLNREYSAAPVCAPSRASFLTGMDQGHAFGRDNEFDQPLRPNYTVASVLKTAGYYTALVGKYGFGASVFEPQPHYPACPLKRGFDTFFGFMSHQDAHKHYPGNHGGIFDGCKPVTHGLKGLYSADMFTAKAKQVIVDHERENPKQPFFLFLAYTLPHFDLTVPTGPYPKGSGLHGGDQWPLRPTGKPNSYIWPAYRHKPWPTLEKHYATMIHRLDRNVGDIRQTLKDLGIAKNTIVIFTSDNGPANEAGQNPAFFQSWGPFDGIKRDELEGGDREPTFVDWPGHVQAGARSNTLSMLFDWLPTFAQLAGLPPPARTDGISLLPSLVGQPDQQNRHTFLYSEYRGLDAGPLTQSILARHDYTRRGQEQAVWIGDFAGLRYNIHSASDPIRLYNVVTDPKEKHDLSGQPQYRKLVQRMKNLMLTSRTPWVRAPRPYDDVPLPAVSVTGADVGGLRYQVYDGKWPWIPDFNALTPVRSGFVDHLGLPRQLTRRKDAFGVQITGFIKVPHTGRYVVREFSDSGLDVWIHDDLVINDGYLHTVAARSGVVRLKAGWQPIRIAYRHSEGNPFGDRLQVELIDPQWNPVTFNGSNLAHGPYRDAPVQLSRAHLRKECAKGVQSLRAACPAH